MPYRDPEKRRACYREWCARNRAQSREMNRRSYLKRRQYCLEKGAEYRAQNRELIRKRNQEYYRRNRDKIREKQRVATETSTNRELRRLREARKRAKKYGMPLELYISELAKRAGRCDACGRLDAKTLRVDHCHNTTIVRGFLCHACNASLGFMEDNPHLLRQLACYAEKFELLSHNAA